jgi:hypothetical protein
MALSYLWMSVIVLAAVLAAAATPVPPPSPWRTLAPGLEVAELAAPHASAVGDSRITVVRIDPDRYEIDLLSAKLLDTPQPLTAKQWVLRHGVLGAINASMYATDHRTSVAYMRSGTALNNGRWSRDNAVFVAGPKEPGLPPVQILDRACGWDVDAQAARYRIAIQNIRMLDCAGKNTWAAQPRKWSTAAVGLDAAGRVLFIHCRSPYATRDFIEALRALPLDLRRLMYVEGGPEASLYVAAGGQEVARMGSFETGFHEADDNAVFWPIPNVIAFRPIAR